MIFPPSSHALRLVRSNLGWQPGKAQFESVSVSRHARVFKVSCPESKPVALKEYAPDFRQTESLQREFTGLRVMERSGVSSVAKALHQDIDHGVAIYEWKEGVAISPTDRGEDVFDPFVEFLGACAKIPSTEYPQWASDAARSGIHLETTIRQRLARIPRDHQDLNAWLESKFEPTLEDFIQKSRQLCGAVLDWDQELAQERRILVPSQLGFANVLETPSRHLVFLDFAGFGQDDPASILAQLLHQSAETATPDQKARLVPKFFEHFGSDPLVGTRFAAFFPLVGLHHTLDLLDPFCPLERALRDFAARPSHPKEDVLARCLERAIHSLEALKTAVSGD
ncbi:MAG: hypothetical protein IPK50_09320 [Fibrobacterota bacterium]|nr:hypothetical protein [Fibrobacterota bacterium]QQS07077.1 MAG: hypothetical protein IPK50_09320 [Fibrobacterota bacterium]